MPPALTGWGPFSNSKKFSMQIISNVKQAAPMPGSAVAAVCPGCNREGNLQPIGQDLQLMAVAPGAQGKQSFVTVGSRLCPNSSCASHVFVVTSVAGLLYAYPAGHINFDTTEIPEKVRRAIEEALTCAANECYVGAAMLIRKSLEAVCQDRQATGKDLKARITDLQKKVTLPSELFDAMDHLRLLGNDAAHIDAKTFDDVGKEEVAAGIELAREIIKATYQYKGLLGRLQALKRT